MPRCSAPPTLTEHRMLYFWVSDDMLGPLVTAAHQDGRFFCNVTRKRAGRPF
uniref:Uncharacterized protein n=1 Tax=Anguilla anguilla TaxID=7936 RepID=A0A0E9PDF5_ANGAN